MSNKRPWNERFIVQFVRHLMTKADIHTFRQIQPAFIIQFIISLNENGIELVKSDAEREREKVEERAREMGREREATKRDGEVYREKAIATEQQTIEKTSVDAANDRYSDHIAITYHYL